MRFRKRQSLAPARQQGHLSLILASDLFDGGWYLRQNADVARAGLDPAWHFLNHGAGEARNPGPDFDSRFYLSSNPDVAASGANPLVHYLLHGEAEGRLRRRPIKVAAPASTDDPFVLPGPFLGSTFDELSIDDPLVLARYIARSATPAEALARVDTTTYSPHISLILVICDAPPRSFREMLQSVLSQTYTNWEICLVDARSSDAQTIAICDELAASPDPRIKALRLDDRCSHARAAPAALAMATGDYVGSLGQDDMLTINALSEVVACLRDDRTIDLVYTDHVVTDHDGQPRHLARKPAWSPEFFASTDYISQFKVMRRSLLLSAGGFSADIDVVRDLGATCALVAAGATVRHLPKPVYLKRERCASVAFSTVTRPGIEDQLIKVYRQYFDQLGVKARQTWPTRFKAARAGAFQPEFTGQRASVALILLCRGPDEREEEIRGRFVQMLGPVDTLHVVSLGTGGIGHAGITIDSDAALCDFIAGLDAEVIAFSTTTGRYLGIDWLTRLAGYVTMAPGIGAAGGKVLDAWLQVRSGGMLLDATGHYRTIAGGSFDDAPAHLRIGQIASNVDAISSQLMATRRDTFLEMGGIGFHAFGDAAGAAYSAALVSAGYRIVYDPQSRHCDMGPMAVSATALRNLRELGRKIAPMRRYIALDANAP